MMDFLRIACAVPRVSLGDPKANAREMAGQMAQAEGQNADLLVFPELSLTGYSCQDLFFQDALYEAALEGLGMLPVLGGTGSMRMGIGRTGKRKVPPDLQGSAIF